MGECIFCTMLNAMGQTLGPEGYDSCQTLMRGEATEYKARAGGGGGGGAGHLMQHRADKNAIPQHELAVSGVGSGVMGPAEEEWASDGRASVMAVLEDCVKGGQQPVA